MIVIINLRRFVSMVPLAVLVLASACSSTPTNNGLTVLATTSILGDVTQDLVGELATVEVLIPSGADPHGFQPSARQAAALRDADIVITNGLDLEAALTDVLEAAKRDGVLVVEIGPQIDPITFAGSDDLDPHFWLDPQRMSQGAAVITKAIAELAEPLRGELLGRLADVQAELAALDEEIVDLLDPITNRKLVTNHDSLGYFAARYGFEVVGTVAPGGSTIASPSPRDVSALIDSLEAQGISAVLTDIAEPDSIAELIADEAGAAVEVVDLFIGSLGPAGSGAESYVGLVRVNAQLIWGALA